MKHFVIDFETMGTKSHDCAVIDCSFFAFDTEKMLSTSPYTTRNIVDMIKVKMSVKEQVDKYGFKVYKDTLEFWQRQSPEVQKLIHPKSDDATLEQYASKLFSYLNSTGKINYWWSRSSSFDPLIIWRLMDVVDLGLSFNEHLPHYKHRDIRTFIDAKLDFPKKNAFCPIEDETFWGKVFQEHNSAWDILADGLRMQAILRAEADLDQIKR